MLKIIYYLPLGLFLFMITSCEKNNGPSLELTPPLNAIVILGDSLFLRATYLDEQGQDKSEEIVWTSRSLAIASVEKGTVRGLNTGQSWIVASVGALRDSILVTVIQDPALQPAKIEITSTEGIYIMETQTRVLKARVLNSAGQVLNNIPVTWQSTNPSAATIDQSGNLVAIASGNTQIVASIGALKSDPFDISVLTLILHRTGYFNSQFGFSVTGSASLFKIGLDGDLKIKLSNNFATSNNAPLMQLVVTNDPVNLADSSSLGITNLTGNPAGQEFLMPAGVSINDYNYVVIYALVQHKKMGIATLD